MSIDLSRLTPAPLYWSEDQDAYVYKGEKPYGYVVCRMHSMTDAEFFVLARNAFAGDPEALAWWEANQLRTEQEKKR